MIGTKLLLTPVVLFFVPVCGSLMAGDMNVDFRYAPEEWQTAICMPDDPAKSLVDKSGELLYHFRLGGREFGTRISVVVSDDAQWVRQELVGPRIPIVRTLREAPGLKVLEEAFAVTQRLVGGADPPVGSPRNDVILVHVSNTGKTTCTVKPRLIVDSSLPVVVDPDGQWVTVDRRERIVASRRMKAVSRGQGDRRIVHLEPMTLAPGRTEQFFVTYAAGKPVVLTPRTMTEAADCRTKAEEYWRGTGLPYDRIQVPDEQVQALIDASIRNIWQAREIKNGMPAFQVGPTCYRGLWIVDGAFLLEAAAMLGAGNDARNGIAYTLAHQKADGRFEILAKYHKENGIVLWTCVRHAMLTQDKEWLESVWPALERVVAYIELLRKETLTSATPLDDGLIPPGFPDGGINGRDAPEYTNVYWNLVGLKAIIHGAHWLGKTEQAALWQKGYDDFYAVFRQAAARDMRSDVHGNRCLPILMGAAGDELPEKGQWAFCHAVYPGQTFTKDDPLVTGNLAMLRATEQQDMVVNTGWMTGGIWTYFASFYGHAWLWQGDGGKAAQCLYAMANHASPLLAWREEQPSRDRPHKKVGDMPHNWASAEFIRLAIHLVALDRGDELHLFEGLPTGWTRPGMATKLRGIVTPFGPLTLDLGIAEDGKSAALRVEALSDPSCDSVVVHLDGWVGMDARSARRLDPSRAHNLVIPIDR